MGEETKALLEFMRQMSANITTDLGELRSAIGSLTREVSRAAVQIEGLRERIEKSEYELAELRSIEFQCPARLNYRDNTEKVQLLEKGKVSKVTGAGTPYRAGDLSPAFDWPKLFKGVGIAVGAATAAAAATLAAMSGTK